MFSAGAFCSPLRNDTTHMPSAVVQAVISELSGPAMVTAGWTLLGMNFMPMGPTAGMVGACEPQKTWGNRTFLNMMEHAPLFLSSLWVFAIFVSAEEATKIGTTYIALRSLYPVIWAAFGGANGAPMQPCTWFLFGKGMNLFYVTFPQYGCVFYMALATLLKLGLAIDLNSIVGVPALAAPLGFGLFLYHFALGGFPYLQKAVAPLFGK